ncbi:ATP-binding protein [Paenibacillus sabuli]|nr:ATP-binding protein [Paenibacillus sabuli]
MNEILESFFNHTTDAIHVVDLERRVTKVNPAFEKLFGWSAAEARGQVLPLVPDDRLGEEQEDMRQLMEGRPLGARETMRRTRQGRLVPVSVTTSLIKDRSGQSCGLASITRDMTSRNQMEELLRQSEKLSTVGQLAAGVAHEIRNPLTTLRGFLQLQQQTNRLNLQHNDLMLSELDRINLIVSEFLILAKPQASKFEQKDIRFILGDVISLLDSEAHLCNIIFETRFTEERCVLACEENQLKQVFINVLKNAIEAMPRGGLIQIEIGRQGPQMLMVTIADEGTGMPESMMAQLGSPFFTGKEAGTGLGIMVSQRIIHMHRGTLDIRSEEGVGTTVTIMLPARDAATGDA